MGSGGIEVSSTDNENGAENRAFPAHTHNRAVVLYGPKDLRIEDRPLPPKPTGHQVLVQMKTVGICGSDVHYWQHGAIGDFVVRSPMVIGHESAGIVVEVGDKVKHVKAGDHVALEPGVPCRMCTPCKTGRYNLCPDIEFFATPPVDGSLAGYVLHPADFCFKLPEEVSLEEGAMCEPLSVAVHACRRANLKHGDYVAVFGAGPIGIITALVAKALGASQVVITDVNAKRVHMAKILAGVDGVVTTGTVEEVAADIQREAGGPVDMAFECCGVEAPTATALKSVRMGGTVVVVGCFQRTMTVPMIDVALRELDVKGVFRYANTYPTCIDLIASGRVNVRPLVTHRYKIDDFIDAFECARDSAQTGAVKVMFDLSDGHAPRRLSH